MTTELTFKSWKVFDYRKNQGVSATKVLTDILAFAGEDGDIDPKQLAQCVSDGSLTLAKEFTSLGTHPPAFLYFESSDSSKQVAIYDTSWTLEEYMVTKWACDAWGSEAHMLACFGLDTANYLGKVDEAYTGSVRIWVERHFFAGFGDEPIPDYIQDEQGNFLKFETYAKAQDWIKSQDDVVEYGRITHHLSGSECAPPTYTICSI